MFSETSGHSRLVQVKVSGQKQKEVAVPLLGLHLSCVGPSREGPGRSGLRGPLELSCSSAFGAILEFSWAVSLSRTVADPSLASPQSVILYQSPSVVLTGLIGAKEAAPCHWGSWVKGMNENQRLILCPGQMQISPKPGMCNLLTLCVQIGSTGPSWSGLAASLPLWPLGRLVKGTNLVQSQMRIRLCPKIPGTDWRPLLEHGSLRMGCLCVLTQEGTLFSEERASKNKGILRRMVSLHPCWLELCKTTGCMLELVQENRAPSIYREGRVHVRGPQCDQVIWQHGLGMA